MRGSRIENRKSSIKRIEDRKSRIERMTQFSILNPHSSIPNGLVDIHLFSPHTSSGLRYARHIEVDLILLLPDRLHPPCIINHRSARFTIYHICMSVLSPT